MPKSNKQLVKENSSDAHHCNECQHALESIWLKKSNQNDEPFGRIYCQPCYENVKKGLFRCYENDCGKLIKTRGYGLGGDKFGLDLNHNIFCWEHFNDKKEYAPNVIPIKRSKICHYCEEPAEFVRGEGQDTWRCEDHTHCLKMSNLKGITGKEFNQKCYKCNQSPKFVIRVDNTDINSKFQCQDEILCDTISKFLLETKGEEEKEKLFTCSWCDRKYWAAPLCPEHKKKRKEANEVHHGTKAPNGKCQQCLEELPTTKSWNGKYYCKDCKDWNNEASQSGIACCKRFQDSFCDDCGECSSCKARKELKKYSTRDLMIEVYFREDLDDILTWEDDWYQTRFQEVMWELNEVKDKSSEEVKKIVSKDIFEKKHSKRKFSRGT